jgi:hypothetical protein
VGPRRVVFGLPALVSFVHILFNMASERADSRSRSLLYLSRRPTTTISPVQLSFPFCFVCDNRPRTIPPYSPFSLFLGHFVTEPSPHFVAGSGERRTSDDECTQAWPPRSSGHHRAIQIVYFEASCKPVRVPSLAAWNGHWDSRVSRSTLHVPNSYTSNEVYERSDR